MIRNVLRHVFSSNLFVRNSYLYIRNKFLHSKLRNKIKNNYLSQIGSDNFIPKIIHVETRSMCNGTCSFCAAAVQFGTRPDILMEDALINKIINELKELNYCNRLSFYNNNEPFLDKRIFDIIKKARDALPEAYLELKTNGVTLNWEKTLKIFDAGLDVLYINDYQKMPSKNFRKNIQIIFDKFKNTRRFKGHFEHNQYHSKIKFYLRDKDEVLGSRAGTAPNKPKVKINDNRPCLRPFEMMTIDPRGKVALCSEDIEFKEVMGDVSQKTIKEIWNTKHYNDLRHTLLKGNRQVKSTCAQCDYAGYSRELLKEYL